MRRNRIAAAALTALLHCGTAGADDGSLPKRHEPEPGLAIASALLNLVFLPIRLPLTIIGAEFAGLTGFLNAGDEHAANDVFGLVDGTQYISPKVLRGDEQFRIGRHD